MSRLKIILILAALLGLQSLSAQEKKYNSKEDYGGWEISFQMGFMPHEVTVGPTYDFDGNYYRSNVDQYNLQSMYGPTNGNVDYCPFFGVHGEYQFSQRFSAGLGLGFYNITTERIDPYTREYLHTNTKNCLSVLPDVKYHYIFRRSFGIYSGARAGVSFNFGDGDTGRESGKSFVYEVVPVGLRLGGMFHFNLEVAIGNVVDGMRIGVGYFF